MGDDQGRARGGAGAPANKSDVERIRDLNDSFRQTFTGGNVLITRGVAALGPAQIARLFRRVKRYDAFDPDNDPYGEHDFGVIDDAGRRLFWKIDYYDRELELGSPNPADPDFTTRVLTIMLAEEW
jgi:Protein of unknown function (DUF3768)